MNDVTEMNELAIDCLEADALTAYERKEITQEQFENRIKKLKIMRGRINEK